MFPVQAVQLPDENPLLNVPAGQIVHDVALPPAAKNPGLQAPQDVLPVPVAKVPGRQTSHCDWPARGWAVPAEHGVHMVAPVGVVGTAAKLPAGQVMHVGGKDIPVEKNVPPGHATQPAAMGMAAFDASSLRKN